MFELETLLLKNGHKTVPFAMADPKNKPTPYEKYFAAPVDVRRFSARDAVKTFYNYEAIGKLKKLLRDEKPDIAHVHNIGNHLSLSVIRTLKKAGVPVVMTLHDYKPLCPNRQLYNRSGVCERCYGGRYFNCARYKCVQSSRLKSLLGMLEGYFFRINKIYDQVGMFIAPSRFMKDICVRFGFDAAKIRVIYNFIDPDKYRPDGSGNRPGEYLFYFGRLTEEKGIWTLLDAMGKTKSGYKLLIAGDGPEKECLARAINETGQADKIKLLGPVYGAALEKLITEAAGVIIPSIWRENMPYSLLEALSYGKTVIASRSGGMPELIRDGESGFLFPPGDSAALAFKIDELKKTGTAGTGEAARRAVAGFNPAAHFGALAAVYEALVKGKNL